MRIVFICMLIDAGCGIVLLVDCKKAMKSASVIDREKMLKRLRISAAFATFGIICALVAMVLMVITGAEI